MNSRPPYKTDHELNVSTSTDTNVNNSALNQLCFGRERLSCLSTITMHHICMYDVLMHVCLGAETAAWRRGAQGPSYAGQHPCNRCGVEQFRYPDPVEVSSV